MDLTKIIKIINKRNENDYTDFMQLCENYKSTDSEYANLLLEYFFSNPSLQSDSFYLLIAQVLKDNNIKAARYFYLIDIINNEKKYASCLSIYGESGIFFDCEWKTLLKQEMYDPLVGAYYFKDKKKDKMINRLINKSKKIDNQLKIEKLLKKAASTNDCYALYELGMFYYKNNNESEALKYLSMSGQRHYHDAAMFLANFCKNQGNHELEIEYLIKGFKKDNPNDYLNIINKLREYNMGLEPIYKTLEWNVYRSDELCYQLAKMYETGDYVQKDELSAYALYICSRGFSDSNKHLENIANNLYHVYKANCDEFLNKFIEQHENKKEEKKQEKELKKNEQLSLISLYPDKQINLNPDYKSYKMLFDKKGQLAEREKFYKKALTKKRAFEIIPLLEKAAECGHHRALLALYDYYQDMDFKKAHEYITICKNTYTGDDKEFIEQLNQKFNLSTKLMKEESDRLYLKRQEQLKIEQEIKRKQEEEKRILLEKQMEEERINNPLSLDKDPEYENIYEDDVDHKNSVDAYAQCLLTKDVPEIVNRLLKAAKLNHPKAIKKLIEYYYGNNEISLAKEWLLIGLRNNVELDDEVSNWKEIDLELAILFASRGYYEGIKYLDKTKDLILTENQIIQIASSATKNNGAFEFLYKYISPTNMEKAIDYAINAAYLGNEKLVYELIGNRIHEKTNPQLVRYLLDTKDTLISDQKNWLLIDVFQVERLSKQFGILHSRENLFNHLLKMQYTSDLTLREKVWIKIGHCYECGYGVEKDLLQASKYYKPYNMKLANECLDKYKYEHGGKNEVLEKAQVLMNKYPCPELDKLLSMDVTQAKLIVNKYGSMPSSIVEKEIIHRDYMLKKGFRIKELYDNLGYYRGDELANKINKNSNTNNQAYNTNINNSQVIINEEILDLPVSENNVKFVMFGKLSKDPNNPESDNYSANIFFPACYCTKLFREYRKQDINLYGSMEAFYCKSLYIDGILVNSHPFSHHLNLTLPAGFHSVEATFEIVQNYSGSIHSSSVYRRSESSDYLYVCNAKNKTFRFTKTLKINNFKVVPGKNIYLSFFAVVYGKWRRLHDAYSGEYVGKERIGVISDFVFVCDSETQVKSSNDYRHLSTDDFIKIEDIGKVKYHPLMPLSNSEEIVK